MKEIYKNPVFYYIAVPSLIALWPLLILAVYLPNVEESMSKEWSEYKRAEKTMGEILTLDRDRLNSAGAQAGAAKFDYATAVENIANSCGISSINYNISAKPVRRATGGQKTQSAMVMLKKVDVTKFAKFLSTIQLRWANLQCESVTLTRQKGFADLWKADLEFKYYY